jgi:hypothetical protein
MKQCSFNASDLISAHPIEQVEGTPVWFNLDFKSKARAVAKIGGCGLYCVSYKGRAIYVGKFLGTESNPFGGDLQKIRWERHIPSLTMRGHKVSLGKVVLAKLKKSNADSILTTELAQADHSAIIKYRGYHASYNRVKFAAMNWDDLQAGPSEFLPNFGFGYVQYEPKDLEGLSDSAIWQLVSSAEVLAREQLHLCCNGESDFMTSVAEPSLSLLQVQEHFMTIMTRLRDDHNCLIDAVHNSFKVKYVVGVTQKRATLPTHLKSDTAMELIEENLPSGWRSEWLERLRLSFQCETLEVHATNTRTYGDVRIRALDLKRQRNLFTMAWRPSDGRFSCRILLEEAQVADCPGVEMQAPSQCDPLKTGFIFDASQNHEAAFEGLLSLITKAHYQAKVEDM